MTDKCLCYPVTVQFSTCPLNVDLFANEERKYLATASDFRLSLKELQACSMRFPNSTDYLHTFKSPCNYMYEETCLSIWINIYEYIFEKKNATLAMQALWSLHLWHRNKLPSEMWIIYSYACDNDAHIFGSGIRILTLTVTWSSVNMGLVYPMPLTIICTYQSLYSML